MAAPFFNRARKYIRDMSSDTRKLYNEFLEKNLALIEKSLEASFPGNWEMEKMNSYVALDRFLELPIDTVATALRTGRNDNISGLKSTTAYLITIKFPELTVTNSRGQRHLMRDMYIRVNLSPLLNFTHAFTGMRTSFTLAEADSNYTFSHLSGQVGSNFSGFCLGSTDFARRIAEMQGKFDHTWFDMFCVQLPDYLSWESLEGGPYKRLDSVIGRSGNTGISFNHNTLASYYKRFLMEDCDFDVELVQNDWTYGLKVINNDKLTKSVTSIVKDKAHLQVYDPVKKTRYSEPGVVSASLVEHWNKQISGNRFKFKGEQIVPKVIGTPPKSGEDNKIRVAHTDIQSTIARMLENDLNRNLK